MGFESGKERSIHDWTCNAWQYGSQRKYMIMIEMLYVWALGKKLAGLVQDSDLSGFKIGWICSI